MCTARMTIREATQKWVGEFSRIPVGIVEKLLEANPDELQEITPASLYDRVDLYDGEHSGVGEITGYDEETGLYTVEMDDGEEIQAERDVFDVRRDDYLPMWGTMWAFGDSSDEDWLERGGLQKIADCGFRIYEQEDYGYIFGIDGAGYSFLMSTGFRCTRRVDCGGMMKKGRRRHDEEGNPAGPDGRGVELRVSGIGD